MPQTVHWDEIDGVWTVDASLLEWSPGVVSAVDTPIGRVEAGDLRAIVANGDLLGWESYKLTQPIHINND